MRLNWEKRGLIYKLEDGPLFKTHTMRTLPYQISDNILRVYFCSRTERNCPLPNFIDVNIKNPQEIININESLIMDFGKLGTFDDSGVVPASFIEINKKATLVYSGWKLRRETVNVEFAIGLAEVNHDKPIFKRLFEGPILAQDKQHPIFPAGPFVLYDEGMYKMWYCWGSEYRQCETGPEPIYRIHYAESPDGINWVPHSTPAIDYKFDGEVMTAPWVIKIGKDYRMWYSTRGSATKIEKNYKLGYATSSNGRDWTRRDEEVGIERSAQGWDSEMMCYPSFFSYGDVTYMFYSGNNVGKEGIGYAVAPRFF